MKPTTAARDATDRILIGIRDTGDFLQFGSDFSLTSTCGNLASGPLDPAPETQRPFLHPLGRVVKLAEACVSLGAGVDQTDDRWGAHAWGGAVMALRDSSRGPGPGGQTIQVAPDAPARHDSGNEDAVAPGTVRLQSADRGGQWGGRLHPWPPDSGHRPRMQAIPWAPCRKASLRSAGASPPSAKIGRGAGSTSSAKRVQPRGGSPG